MEKRELITVDKEIDEKELLNQIENEKLKVFG